jgi:chorismate synthase
MGLVLEDILPGIDFPHDELKSVLQKRKPNQSEFSSTRAETDDYEILSGICAGKTTGMPICILFRNTDVKSVDYDEVKNAFRPGHADFGWFKKFKIYDFRGGGRASGRETICRVAAGSLVKHRLSDIDISIYPVSIGTISVSKIDLKYSQDNYLQWPDETNFAELQNYLRDIKNEKDSIGSIVEVIIKNVPIGLGDPVFEKLDANLAKAIMSIPGVKGIEFGVGFSLSFLRGSEANDSIVGSATNHLGGIIGGISNGKDIVIRIALRAPSSIGKLQNTITYDEQPTQIKINGRHDILLIPRIFPVIEAMAQLILADAIAFQDLISVKNPNLNDLRETIDKIDEDILLSLYKRLEIVKQIAEIKKSNHIDIIDEHREKQVYNLLCEKATYLGLNTETIQNIWNYIIDESRKLQKK